MIFRHGVEIKSILVDSPQGFNSKTDCKLLLNTIYISIILSNALSLILSVIYSESDLKSMGNKDIESCTEIRDSDCKSPRETL